MKLTIKVCEQCNSEFSFVKKAGPVRKFCSKKCTYNAFYRRNQERLVKELRKKSEDNPERFMLYGAKARAIKKGIEFDLELSDIVVPEVCPVLGIPLFSQKGQGTPSGPTPNSPSIDRIDSKKGYVKGNVRVISTRANLAKGDFTVEELELVLKDLKKLEHLQNMGAENETH